MSFGSGNCGIFLFFFICGTAATFQLGLSYYLGEWTKQDVEEQKKPIYLNQFAIVSLCFVILMIVRSTIIFLMFLSATTRMHNTACYKILRSGILFFDSNPSGRITTRFSRDLSIMDGSLPGLTSFVAHALFRSFFIIVTICLINPWLLIPVSIGMVVIKYYQAIGTPAQIDC